MAEFAGKVTLLEIEGAGEGASAQLGFILTPADSDVPPRNFVLPSDQAPRGFAAIAALLTAAYAANLLVTVVYQSGDPAVATHVRLGGQPQRKPGRMGFV